MRKLLRWKAVFVGAALLGLLLVSADPAGAQAGGGETPPAAEAAAETAAQPAEEAQPSAPPAVPLYVNPVWLLLFAAGVAVWLYATSWVSIDARGTGMDDRQWSAIMLGTGLVGVLLTLLLHGIVSLLIFAVVAGTVAVYVKRRNERVPERQKLLGPEHWARILNRIPLLGRLQTQPSRTGALPSVQAGLVNQNGESLDAFLEGRPQLAEAGALLQDLVGQAASVHGQEARLMPYRDGYLTRVTLDSVPQSLEAVDQEQAREVIACATAFLALTGRAGGAARLRVQLGGGNPVEVSARLRSSDGKPSLVFDFPDWTPNLYQEGLEALGMHEALVNRVRAALEQDRAAVIISGGPRSGKTTTLHAAIGQIDIFTHEVLALEEESEHDLGQVKQFPFSREDDFEEVFAAVRREAPHVIVLGDLQKPIEAGLLLDFAAREGKILTDLEAHGACAALANLVRMTDPPQLVSKAVTCVTSQVLVRKLCVNCREPFEPAPESLRKLGVSAGEEPVTWFRPVGCEACLNSGYHGRTGLFSMLILTDAVRSALRETSVSPASIRKAAGKNALRTLYEDGLGKVAAGITSLDEVRRVLKTDSPNRRAKDRAQE